MFFFIKNGGKMERWSIPFKENAAGCYYTRCAYWWDIKDKIFQDDLDKLE